MKSIFKIGFEEFKEVAKKYDRADAYYGTLEEQILADNYFKENKEKFIEDVKLTKFYIVFTDANTNETNIYKQSFIFKHLDKFYKVESIYNASWFCYPEDYDSYALELFELTEKEFNAILYKKEEKNERICSSRHSN